VALSPDTGFRVRFPEFSAVSDARVQAFLDDAVVEIRAAIWGDFWRRAVNLYTAHMLALAEMQAAGSTGSVGPVASRSVGDVSISFAVSAGTGGAAVDWMGSTGYGQELLRLINVVGVDLLVVYWPPESNTQNTTAGSLVCASGWAMAR